MTLEETLRAFTAGSAHAAFDEDRLGTLKVGMRADVTVVDRDLFQADPRRCAQGQGDDDGRRRRGRLRRGKP